VGLWPGTSAAVRVDRSNSWRHPAASSNSLLAAEARRPTGGAGARWRSPTAGVGQLECGGAWGCGVEGTARTRQMCTGNFLVGEFLGIGFRISLGLFLFRRERRRVDARVARPLWLPSTPPNEYVSFLGKEKFPYGWLAKP
jgi:hypothetical protein